MSFLRAILAAALVCIAVRAAEDPEVLQAKAELSRVQGLVESGALPPAQLEKTKEKLADAEDGAVLRNSTAQPDLTEAQADELTAAAARQFERRKQAFDCCEAPSNRDNISRSGVSCGPGDRVLEKFG